MRILATLAAVLLTASLSLADSGVLLPGQDIHFGNLHVANLVGATGNVNYTDDGTNLTMVVHDGAVCAVLKNGRRRQARDVTSLILGGGFYAQGNVSGAYMLVLGDNAVALALALNRRHVSNANTIDLWGNGNIAAAIRWCYGRGEVLLNRIRFGASALFPGNDNDAYISGDRRGTFDLAWANRSEDIAGQGNETIAFDGFPCPRPTATDVEERPADLAVDVDAIR